MKARDIKDQITINHNSPANTTGILEAINEEKLDKELIVNIGDTLIAGSIECKVTEIIYMGNLYDLHIRIDNGQKIAMNQLAEMIKNNQITIKED